MRAGPAICRIDPAARTPVIAELRTVARIGKCVVDERPHEPEPQHEFAAELATLESPPLSCGTRPSRCERDIHASRVKDH